MHIYIYTHTHTIYVYTYICINIYLSICLSIYLSIYLPIYLSTYLSIYPSIYINIYEVDHLLTPKPPLKVCIYEAWDHWKVRGGALGLAAGARILRRLGLGDQLAAVANQVGVPHNSWTVGHGKSQLKKKMDDFGGSQRNV
jgi:hypothetical protein